MRLFVGVELPDSIKDTVAAVAEDMRGRIARDAPGAVLRWVPPANFHITIWFLGEVPETGVELVVSALKTPLDASAVRLGFGGAGVYPRSNRPRAVWIGLTAGRDGLLAVHDRLRPRLVPLGFEPESRPYDPHLTIARVKELRSSDVPALQRILPQVRTDLGQCEIGNATLFRSRSTPTGSEYESVLLVPLV